jgi:valyl-tRNA synthetase
VTRAVLRWTLAETMKLLHPIMPSLTEEIWQALPHEGRTIMRAPWPAEVARWIDHEAEGEMAMVTEIVRAIRGMRADLGITAGELVPVDLYAPSEHRALLEATARYIGPLARARVVRIHEEHAPRPSGGFSALSGPVEVTLRVESGEAAAAMRTRLEKQVAAVTRDLAGLETRLKDAAFLERAPAEVVAGDRIRRDELSARRAALERYLVGLGAR